MVECLPIVCKAQGFLLKIIKVSLRGRGKDEVEGYRKPDFFGGLVVMAVGLPSLVQSVVGALATGLQGQREQKQRAGFQQP